MSKFKRYFTSLFLLSALVLTGCGSGGGGDGGSTASSGGGGGGGLIAITCEGGGTGGPGSIVGSWSAVGGPSDPRDLSVITFFSDGTYMMVTDVDVVKHPTEQVGMERGTYTWDAATGDFTIPTITVDTNGQSGFDHLTSNLCVEVNGNKLTVKDDTETGEATRVVDVAGSIVGSWYLGNTGTPNDLSVFTFFSDGISDGIIHGTYMLAESGIADLTGGPGMELGTFTYNATTGAFSSTCPSVDTSGDWGLSHGTPGVCSGSQYTVTISGDGNKATFAGSDGFTLIRVVPL